jgi:hypothetical protein
MPKLNPSRAPETGLSARLSVSIDLRTLDRHRGAAISSLIPSLSCRRCSPHAQFAHAARWHDERDSSTRHSSQAAVRSRPTSPTGHKFLAGLNTTACPTRNLCIAMAASPLPPERARLVCRRVWSRVSFPICAIANVLKFRRSPNESAFPFSLLFRCRGLPEQIAKRARWHLLTIRLNRCEPAAERC